MVADALRQDVEGPRWRCDGDHLDAPAQEVITTARVKVCNRIPLVAALYGLHRDLLGGTVRGGRGREIGTQNVTRDRLTRSYHGHSGGHRSACMLKGAGADEPGSAVHKRAQGETVRDIHSPRMAIKERKGRSMSSKTPCPMRARRILPMPPALERHEGSALYVPGTLCYGGPKVERDTLPLPH